MKGSPEVALPGFPFANPFQLLHPDGTHATGEATVHQLREMVERREYLRLAPFVRGNESAYRALDEEHRRDVEAYYWGSREVQGALHLSRTTLYIRRMHICRVLLAELRRASVPTYAFPGGVFMAGVAGA